MAELLRGYVDAEEPEASRAGSSAEGGGGLEALLRDYLDQEAVPEARTGDDDAVDDLLRRYMDDDEEEATAAPAGGDDELAELLRSYVDEEDPR